MWFINLLNSPSICIKGGRNVEFLVLRKGDKRKIVKINKR